MEAAPADRAAPAGQPFAVELAVARDAALAPTERAAPEPVATALTTRVPLVPEPADARPAGFAEREWRQAVRAHVVEEAIDVTLPAALAVLVSAWVVVYAAAIVGIPGAGWAAYVGGLFALGVSPWLVWRVAAGKPAVRIPRRSTGEPAYGQLVANDAPRRWRRHADAHGPASGHGHADPPGHAASRGRADARALATGPGHADAVQFATRAVRPPGGGVRLEVLAYEPIGRWAAVADDGEEGWQPDVSREDDRFWRMRVVEHVTILDEDADALAEALARLEASARDRETTAQNERADAHAHALEAHDADRERAASEHGLVAGTNSWTRRR